MPSPHRVTVSVSDDELKVYRGYAKAVGLPLSQAVKRLVRSGLEAAALGDTALVLKDTLEALVPLITETYCIVRNDSVRQYPGDQRSLAMAVKDQLAKIQRQTEDKRSL